MTEQPGTEQPGTERHVAEVDGVGPPEAGAPSPPAPTPAEVRRSRTAAGSRPVVARACDAPERWGRVADDGTVYVRIDGTERPVGSWQAGDAAEGLAHFARRFDDLLTEAELAETRLDAGHGDPKQALARSRILRREIAEPAVVGDLVGLAALLEHLETRAEQAAAEAKAAREQARADAVARKRALVEEAERIAAEATQWKAAGDRLRAILEEWKTVRGVDRKTDDALWRRFGRARDAFNRRRGAHFAELDRQRSTAKARKEELVAEAERLADSADWAATASRYRDLMAEWKAAGRAARDVDDTLWERFRAAQNRFFARRAETFSERDAELHDNARRKEELLAELERIDPAADLEAARTRLRSVQQRWESVGRVPRERVRELEGRLRAVEEQIRSATEGHWRRRDPEAQARVEQFRQRVEQFEAQAAKAWEAGDERRARRAEEQAAQWREWLATAEHAIGFHDSRPNASRRSAHEGP